MIFDVFFCCITVLFLQDKSCLQHFYNMNLCSRVLHALKYSAIVCSVHPSEQCQHPECRDEQLDAEVGVKDSYVQERIKGASFSISSAESEACLRILSHISEY